MKERGRKETERTREREVSRTQWREKTNKTTRREGRQRGFKRERIG